MDLVLLFDEIIKQQHAAMCINCLEAFSLLETIILFY